MNATKVKAWIKALRSGEYEQAHGILSRGGAYCCLGVACKLNEDQVIDSMAEWYIEEGSYSTEDARFHAANDWQSEGQISEVAPTLANELGLTNDDENHLIHLNDDRKNTFDQIADWIEQNILTRAS